MERETCMGSVGSSGLHAGGGAAGGVRTSPFVKRVLIGLAVFFILVLIVLPLAIVCEQALRKGWDVFLQALTDDYTASAVKLTLLVAAITVPLNGIFGLAIAWAMTKYRFRGKNFLFTLVDLPFAVSPVIAGLIYVLMYGANSWLAPVLDYTNTQIIFAAPGIVLATLFVTFPFVARELIPLMQAQGVQEEEAAVTLGASGWRIFWQVTLPNIKWALLYGLILCNARAMGEFGAVSVVSGHIRGQTNTLPLHIEILYNEYQFVEAFAVSMLLVVLAVVTLIAKQTVEGWKS